MNDLGLEICHLTTVEEFKASQDLKITGFENLGYEHSPIWNIDVDNPLINKFLLDMSMFEEIEE